MIILIIYIFKKPIKISKYSKMNTLTFPTKKQIKEQIISQLKQRLKWEHDQLTNHLISKNTLLHKYNQELNHSPSSPTIFEQILPYIHTTYTQLITYNHQTNNT